jgi:Protein of unknown function (DUF3147)
LANYEPTAFISSPESPMFEILSRFLLGGLIVSIFALAGDLFKPKSFAGLFGAAPSVALATLILTLARHAHQYAAVEALSMIIGAAAFFVYAQAVTWVLLRRPMGAIKATLLLLPVWFAVALGGWWLLLRQA